MINRSRMRDVGDTRSDFEELGDAINAGLYLKEGINREGEDLYFMYTLIEVVADDLETLGARGPAGGCRDSGDAGAAGRSGGNAMCRFGYAGETL